MGQTPAKMSVKTVGVSAADIAGKHQLIAAPLSSQVRYGFY
jgi:hypothetical protein